MQLDLGRTRRKKNISLTPLIDVVFILLLFFMLSSHFLHMRQIDVSAISDKNQKQDLSKPLMVKLMNNKGEFRVEGKTISIQNKGRMKKLVQSSKDAVFVIEAVNGIKTQTMINVLDGLKQAGAKSVSLAGIN